MNWIKKGIKKELNALRLIKTWMTAIAIVGFCSLFARIFNIDLRLMAVAMGIISIILFLLTYYKRGKK